MNPLAGTVNNILEQNIFTRRQIHFVFISRPGKQIIYYTVHDE